MNKTEAKYELTDNKITVNHHTLYQIRALKDFDKIKSGELGGFIESDENLSQTGNCWIGEDVKIYGRSKISGDAYLDGKMIISGDNVKISNDAIIHMIEKVENNKAKRYFVIYLPLLHISCVIDKDDNGCYYSHPNLIDKFTLSEYREYLKLFAMKLYDMNSYFRVVQPSIDIISNIEMGCISFDIQS